MSKTKNPPAFSNKYKKEKPVVAVKPTPVTPVQPIAHPEPKQPAERTMSLQTIEQQRAKHALKWASEGMVSKETLSAASGFPAMILMNGLGQAAAFYKSKGGEQGKLYGLLSDWLCSKGKPYQTSRDLLTGITEQDMHTYRVAQAEALAYLQWVKKFAKAYAPPKE